jgi:hypothetical protein
VAVAVITAADLEVITDVAATGSGLFYYSAAVAATIMVVVTTITS